jgi:hypothetical protein
MANSIFDGMTLDQLLERRRLNGARGIHTSAALHKEIRQRQQRQQRQAACGLHDQPDPCPSCDDSGRLQLAEARTRDSRYLGWSDAAILADLRAAAVKDNRLQLADDQPSTPPVEHTPGPWATSRDAVPKGHVQVTVYAENTGERVATVFQAEANAELVAAAPAMLALLQRWAELPCESELDDDSDCSDENLCRVCAYAWAVLQLLRRLEGQS